VAKHFADVYTPMPSLIVQKMIPLVGRFINAAAGSVIISVSVFDAVFANVIENEKGAY
jgi:hypothetical protein